jgi:hypothetical protein
VGTVRGVVEWLMPSRQDLPQGHPEGVLHDSVVVHQTELADVSGGRIIVETRHLGIGRWETTIYPADDSDPDGPGVVVFARCGRKREATQAHDRAVTLAADALNSTLRRPDTWD